jgi:hypothetical protein
MERPYSGGITLDDDLHDPFAIAVQIPRDAC